VLEVCTYPGSDRGKDLRRFLIICRFSFATLLPGSIDIPFVYWCLNVPLQLAHNVEWRSKGAKFKGKETWVCPFLPQRCKQSCKKRVANRIASRVASTTANRTASRNASRVDPLMLHFYPLVLHGYPLLSHGYSLVLHSYLQVSHGYPLMLHFYPLVLHGYLLVSRGYPLLSHGYSLVLHSYLQVSHGYPLLSHGYSLVLHSYLQVSHGYPLMPHGYSLVLHSYPQVSLGYPLKIVAWIQPCATKLDYNAALLCSCATLLSSHVLGWPEPYIYTVYDHIFGDFPSAGWSLRSTKGLILVMYGGLARTIYIRCIYGVFGREITKYTVKYGVCVQLWPTLHVRQLLDLPFFCLRRM